MSPERPPSSDGGPVLESPNMILSSIPIESGHVVLQSQQQQHHHHQQPGINSSNVPTTMNIPQAIVGAQLRQMQQQQQQYQQSQQNPSSTTSSKLLVLQPNQLNDNYITTTDTNAVGNIVLLATEQMEVGSIEQNGLHGNSSADEELTSLTWLHDKNLLKGINLTCTNGNISKTSDENDSPHRQNSSGVISPTSDFLDDSCVSEDNASSPNSLSDQGISVYSTESPTTYQFINNNNSINKNRNQMPTTQVIQLGPSGTVIEYITPNLQGKINTVLQQTTSSSAATSTVITSTSTMTTSVAPTHQHFHKKYLREEHNKTLKQMTNYASSPVKQEYNSSSNYDTSSSIISEKDYPTTPIRQQQYNQTEPSSPDSYSSPSNQTPLQKQSPHKLKHPTNMPYDPLIHTNNKPPLSFSSLIFLAIEDSIEKALPVKEIYAWIVAHYPYFKTAPTGWKNSVRHNLSLNKCFQKVEKAPNMGKGSLWRVEQQYKQNLIQALTRSSYHPCTNSLDKSPYKVSPRPSESPPGFKSGARPLDADLFPRLSKFMSEMASNDDTPSPPGTPIEDDYHQQIITNNNNNTSSSNKNLLLAIGSGGNIVYNSERIVRDWGADSIDDVNAATAMLALKHGPKVFNESFRNGNPPIITSSPSEDHTYSAGGLGSKRSSNNNSDNNSNGTSSDAAYESSEESHSNSLTKEELDRQHAEGVDAFLTFATEVSSMSSPIKRPPSPDSHNGTYMEHIPNHYFESSIIHHSHSNNHFAYLSSPPPPKKSRSRTLRTKLKKKAWLR